MSYTFSIRKCVEKYRKEICNAPLNFNLTIGLRRSYLILGDLEGPRDVGAQVRREGGTAAAASVFHALPQRRRCRRGDDGDGAAARALVVRHDLGVFKKINV